jgi:hypothetical protein
VRFDVFFIDLSLVTCVAAAFFVAMMHLADKTRAHPNGKHLERVTNGTAKDAKSAKK